LSEPPLDPTQRFSQRADNYARYRPHYPPGLVAHLQAHCGLGPGSIVADVGAGTGILSELWLRAGCTVHAVEPNDAMRETAQHALASHPRCSLLKGTAEDTTLSTGSVDFVTAGQAWHWFDVARARAEFKRILRPDGWLVLVWNDRRTDTPFLAAYEDALQRWGIDYARSTHRDDTIRSPDAMAAEFARDFGWTVVDHRESADLARVLGALLSSSYAPLEEHPNHAPMMAEVRDIFEHHQQNGRVSFDYDTRVYYGRL
jgi:SAM-dependent methyltransferase